LQGCDEIEIKEQKKKKSDNSVPLRKILHPKIVKSILRDADLTVDRFIELMKLRPLILCFFMDYFLFAAE